MASEPIYYLAKETQDIVIIIFGYHIVCQIMNYFLAKTHITHSLIACVQTSPVSSVARGKGTTKEIGDVWTQAKTKQFSHLHHSLCQEEKDKRQRGAQPAKIKIAISRAGWFK